MTNSILLRSKLLSSRYPARQIAVQVGISEASLKKKIGGKREFRASEIATLSALLKLSEQEKIKIFLLRIVIINHYSEMLPARTPFAPSGLLGFSGRLIWRPLTAQKQESLAIHPKRKNLHESILPAALASLPCLPPSTAMGKARSKTLLGC